ncbi:hypothetical protein Pyn_22940 [Prunus yedoensis var. nudiflora]|uniref:Uncharacterized protein n=1 Tax=Prunus yedoensis var. nudiflora TaxID=2094558 RepID=A0A314Y1M0_PRUYE|nr:hypothetical protein Pyn_22940 [Prunus yedoensis var. nudiflora]
MFDGVDGGFGLSKPELSLGWVEAAGRLLSLLGSGLNRRTKYWSSKGTSVVPINPSLMKKLRQS